MSYNFSQIQWHSNYGVIVDHFLNRPEPILLISELPGAGQAVLARRLASLLGEDKPFRAPHHTISQVGMKGRIDADFKYQDGEISLATDGVLYLDDIAEFRGGVLNEVKEALDTKALHFPEMNVFVGFNGKPAPKVVASMDMKWASMEVALRAMASVIQRLGLVPFYFPAQPYHQSTKTMTNEELLERYQR